MNSERISPFWVNGYQPFSAIYFTKLSKHSKFSEDEDVLKGYIKQYKDKRIDTANSIYF